MNADDSDICDCSAAAAAISIAQFIYKIRISIFAIGVFYLWQSLLKAVVSENVLDDDSFGSKCYKPHLQEIQVPGKRGPSS